MSWKDKRAIERIFNTFKRNNKFIFQQDVDALKQLKESIEETEKNTAIDNVLFAKLLCQIIRLNVMYYRNINMAIKETGYNLQLPISYHLEHLQRVLNENDISNFIANNPDIDLKDQKNSSKFIDKLKTNWTLENVSKSFYRTANDFLKDIENYK